MSESSFKAEFIKENGFYLSTPQGGSMKPFIHGDTDTVVIAPVDQPLRKYDVVLYEKSTGEHVLHRVIRKKEGGYLIRGDNCYFTERVKNEQLMGRLVGLYRNGNTEKNLLDGKRYRMRVRLWVWAYPFRYAARRVVSSIRNKLKGIRRKQ